MGEGFAALRARRRLRRGRAHAQVGPAPARRAHRRHRPRGPDDPGRVGQAPGAEPRVQDHEGRDVPVRGGRVRARIRDRGARARAGPRAHRQRDGARRPRRSPARLRPARADLARREHGPRRLHQGPREHARAPEPLVAQGVRRTAVHGRNGRRDPLPVPVDHAPSQRCEPGRSRPLQGIWGGREDPVGRHRVDRPGHVRVLQRRVARAERSGGLRADLAAVVGAVRDRVGDLPADRAAALAHDRRPPGARVRGQPPAAHADAHPGGVRAHVPGGRADLPGPDPERAVRRLRRAVLGAGRRGAGVRGELLRARLARRAPVVRALRRAGVHRGHGPAAVRGRGPGRDRRGAVRGRDGHGGGAVRVARRRPARVFAPAQGEHVQESRTSWVSRGAGGSRSPCSRSCWPSRRCSTRA